MEAIERFLLQIVYFFMNNWIAAAILAVVLILAVIKKPKELFKMTAFLVLVLGVFYIMGYLEKSMFSGVSSKQDITDVELRTKNED